jgi:CTP synthase
MVKPNTLMSKVYKESESTRERHRHRYEFNNEFREILQENGLVISGTSPDETLVEAVELSSHPFFIGVQYHPEFKSRPNRPHPLFSGFIAASLGQQS